VASMRVLRETRRFRRHPRSVITETLDQRSITSLERP
jgi:hypothetical protein